MTRPAPSPLIARFGVVAVDWPGIDLAGEPRRHDLARVRIVARVPITKGWLAFVRPGEGDKAGGFAFTFQREFTRGVEDEEGRAERTYKVATDGVYAAESLHDYPRRARVFFRVEGARVVAWSYDDDAARAWLGMETRAAIAEREAAEAKEAALQPLEGTERQVRWAQSIRLETLAWTREHAPALQRGIALPDEARWWIDRRTQSCARRALGAAGRLVVQHGQAGGERLGLWRADLDFARDANAGVVPAYRRVLAEHPLSAMPVELLMGAIVYDDNPAAIAPRVATGSLPDWEPAKAFTRAYVARLLERVERSNGMVEMEPAEEVRDALVVRAYRELAALSRVPDPVQVSVVDREELAAYSPAPETANDAPSSRLHLRARRAGMSVCGCGSVSIGPDEPCRVCQSTTPLTRSEIELVFNLSVGAAREFAKEKKL